MNDKSKRLVQAVDMLAMAINAKVDKEKLERTALLCKCDLVTGMVIEFTELQGVMGREYAKLDGEAPEVALVFTSIICRALPVTSCDYRYRPSDRYCR